MTDKIAEWIEKLATGKKARIFWAIVIALIVALFILFPFIDANLLFYNRIETRINNLEKLVSISGMTVSEDPSLHAEYQDILLNMETARQNSVVSFSVEGFVKESSAFDTTVKFWSGTIVGIILSIACLFNKNPNGKTTIGFFLKNNLMICIVCLIMGAVFGWLFTLIPTLGSVWINAIAAPIVQFVFLDLLISTPQKKK